MEVEVRVELGDLNYSRLLPYRTKQKPTDTTLCPKSQLNPNHLPYTILQIELRFETAGESKDLMNKW